MIYFWKSWVQWYQIWHVQQNFPPTCFQCFLDSLKTNLHREGDKSHSQKVHCILQNAAKTRLQFLLCSKSWPDFFRVFKEPSVGDHHLTFDDRIGERPLFWKEEELSLIRIVRIKELNPRQKERIQLQDSARRVVLPIFQPTKRIVAAAVYACIESFTDLVSLISDIWLLW